MHQSVFVTLSQSPKLEQLDILMEFFQTALSLTQALELIHCEGDIWTVPFKKCLWSICKVIFFPELEADEFHRNGKGTFLTHEQLSSQADI